MRPAHAMLALCRGSCRHLPAGTELDLLSPPSELVAALSGAANMTFWSPATSLDVTFRTNLDPGRIVACPVRGRAIAAAYRAGPGWDDGALAAYRAFRAETAAQFESLTRPVRRGGLGIHVEVSVVDPYPHAAAMVADVATTGRLRIFATGGAGNKHPYLSGDENNMFRAVHDLFGHLASGRGFDRHGEEAAWVAHSRQYSPLARLAMTTETRGQTSTFIWQHQGRRFPDQKLMLLPAAFCDPTQVSVLAR